MADPDRRDRAGRVAPAAALVLGGLIVLLLAALVPLAIASRRAGVAELALLTALTLGFGAVGYLVARRQPANPIGWILCVVSVLIVLCTFEAPLYLLIAYRTDPGRVPFGMLAVFLGQLWAAPLLLGPVAILLFPDGRLPSDRWRWVLWAYAAASAVALVVQLGPAISVAAGARVVIDSGGVLTSPGPHLPGVIDGLAPAIGAVLVVWILGCWIAFVVRQVMAFRSSVGVRRQQLKWVMCGGAVTAMSIPVFITGSSWSNVAAAVAVAGLTALPISIGVGILRYRLYDIDRIVSRTLSYAILSALLAGLYLAGVFLIGSALERLTGQSGALAVTLATLAVAAAFQPLRGRVRRAVDRRFYRRRYDAVRTLEVFSNGLRTQTDLDALRSDLLGAVADTVQPNHVAIWLRNP